MKRWMGIGAILLLASPLCAAQPAPQPHAPGIESPGYVWNAMEGEKLEALKAKADAKRGAIAFEVCQGCHRRGALGRSDGTYPRLAGQHATVLIKQMTDVRAGRRENARMLPFASEHVLTAQDIADVALYLQGLPVPDTQGKGPGKDLAKGKSLYQRDCAVCHGRGGEGNGPEFQPRLSGQHYLYLVREARSIRDGERRNADPKMVKAIAKYTDAELESVLDHVSRLPVTGK